MMVALLKVFLIARLGVEARIGPAQPVLPRVPTLANRSALTLWASHPTFGFLSCEPMSSPSFTVRRATLEDLSDLVRIWSVMSFDTEVLSKKVTEFQVGQDQLGKIV